jgi:hypothetical protein
MSAYAAYATVIFALVLLLGWPVLRDGLFNSWSRRTALYLVPLCLFVLSCSLFLMGAHARDAAGVSTTESRLLIRIGTAGFLATLVAKLVVNRWLKGRTTAK